MYKRQLYLYALWKQIHSLNQQRKNRYFLGGRLLTKEELKKQVCEAIEAASKEIEGLACRIEGEPEPVSYTHLDVYKRQVWQTCGQHY